MVPEQGCLTRIRLDPTPRGRKDVRRRHLKNQEGGWGHASWQFIVPMSPSVTPGPFPSSSLENPKFPGILARLEESPVCQRLPLTSFLILPFQRVTRLKMLVEVPGGHRATVRAVRVGVGHDGAVPSTVRLG